MAKYSDLIITRVIAEYEKLNDTPSVPQDQKRRDIALQKAEQALKSGELVIEEKSNLFEALVRKCGEGEIKYLISKTHFTCECDAYVNTGKICYHIAACDLFKEFSKKKI